MVAEFLFNWEAVTQRFLPENKQSPLWKERTQEFILRPLGLVLRPTMLYFLATPRRKVPASSEKNRAILPSENGPHVLKLCLRLLLTVGASP